MTAKSRWSGEWIFDYDDDVADRLAQRSSEERSRSEVVFDKARSKIVGSVKSAPESDKTAPVADLGLSRDPRAAERALRASHRDAMAVIKAALLDPDLVEVNEQGFRAWPEGTERLEDGTMIVYPDEEREAFAHIPIDGDPTTKADPAILKAMARRHSSIARGVGVPSGRDSAVVPRVPDPRSDPGLRDRKLGAP